MNSKLYTIGFFVLLVINMGLVVMLVVKPKPHNRERGAREQIIQKLALTETQKKQFREMITKHRESMHSLMTEEKALVQAYFEQLVTINSAEERQVRLEKIMKLKEQKMILTYHHFEELRSLCNEEQLANFEEVIATIIPRIVNDAKRPARRGKPE